MEIEEQSLPETRNITVLDLGSSKLRCINFNINKDGEIEVLGRAENYSSGIKGGSILNVEGAVSSINSVVGTVEKLSEENIDEIYVCITDCGMTSKTLRSQIEINNKKVTENDILLLKKKITDRIEAEVIHTIQLDCHIDGIQEVLNPIGMYGKALNIQFHMITALKTLLLNLESSISQCKLKLKGCAFSAYSSAVAALSADEKELGAVLIDIGSQYTSVSVFQKKKCCFASTIPVGGMHITKDLACGLNITILNAEKIKKICANFVLDETQSKNKIDLATACDGLINGEVSFSDIAEIIKPRIEEIFEMIQEKVRNYNFSTVIIAGGGSKITGTEKIAEKIFKKKSRMQEGFEMEGVLYGTEYSSIIGLIKMIQNLYEHGTSHKSKTSYFGKFLKVLALK